MKETSGGGSALSLIPAAFVAGRLNTRRFNSSTRVAVSRFWWLSVRSWPLLCNDPSNGPTILPSNGLSNGPSNVSDAGDVSLKAAFPHADRSPHTRNGNPYTCDRSPHTRNRNVSFSASATDRLLHQRSQRASCDCSCVS